MLIVQRHSLLDSFNQARLLPVAVLTESTNGMKVWTQWGAKHRDDGPAVEFPDGTKQWYNRGKLDRQNGPAIEYADGTKLWFRNGLRHRDNGPAEESPDGHKEWWRNGNRHREDGPAVVIPLGNGTSLEHWYLRGCEVPKPKDGERPVLHLPRGHRTPSPWD